MTDNHPARFTEQPSAMKLTATNVILAGTSRENIAHELLQYDCRLDDNTFIAVVTVEDFNQTLGMPQSTPWVLVETAAPMVITLLKGRFGNNVTAPAAIKLLNDQYAMDPKRLGP